MRFSIILFFITLSSFSFAQKQKFKLNNVVIVGLLDRDEDRFTVEISLSELFASSGIKTMSSLNLLKQGSEPSELANDSLRILMNLKGYDTYLLVSVRGYDRKFKPTTNHPDMRTELMAGHSFPLYREDIVSVTLEFNFYREGQFVFNESLKIGGIGSREAVLKKMRKKLKKKIEKSWK